MSFLSRLFGGSIVNRPVINRSVDNRAVGTDPGNTAQIMGRLNPNALVGMENGVVVIIEDVTDPDGRMYRMEYQSTPDGRHATGYCRHNPWGDTPNVGESSIAGHVFEDGSICMGAEHYGGSVEGSPYTLETVLQRSRFWCTAFSVLKETGEFPNP